MCKFYDIPSDYMGQLPEVFQGVEEMELLAKIINPWIDALNGKIRRTVDNKTVTYADQQGIERWEKILGVLPPINATLEARRNACLAKLRTMGIINLTTLRNVVETYLGVPVDIEMWWDSKKITWGEAKEAYKTWQNVRNKKWGDFYKTPEPYVIYIYYRGTGKLPDLTPLYKMLYDMIPANLIVKILYKYQTWGEAKENYKTWGAAKGLTWDAAKLGNRL